MYEEYYGLTEKPFSLTPDPRFLYRSESHANGFDLLNYAIRRREGFVVVTGDIGTGKTTLCRALLDQLDRRTFTALVLNPFLEEEDLITLILEEFGVVSRDEIRRGCLRGVSKLELVDTLNEFLLSLLPLGARAVVIVDEAQNLAPKVLEQIRILSNLETDREKLLQVIFVGQLNLDARLRSPEMRQIDQRVSLRHRLDPLTREETAAYVAHRLQIAGGGGAVSFTTKALDLVHRFSGGTPRLVNLICDRALLSGAALRTRRIPPEAVLMAADTLHLRPARHSRRMRVRRTAGALTAGAVASVLVGASAAGLARETIWRPAWTVPGLAGPSMPAESHAQSPDVSRAGLAEGPAVTDRAPARLGTGFAILVGSFADTTRAASVRQHLHELGYPAEMLPDAAGRSSQIVIAGFADEAQARAAAARLQAMPEFAAARVVGWRP